MRVIVDAAKSGNRDLVLKLPIKATRPHHLLLTDKTPKHYRYQGTIRQHNHSQRRDSHDKII